MNELKLNKKFDAEVDNIDLKSLLFTLLDNKWLIAIFVFVSMLIGFSYALQQPSLYKANVILQFKGKKQISGLGNLAGLAQQFGTPAATDDPATIHEVLIRSRYILGPVIDKLGLDIETTVDKSFFNKLFSKQQKQISIKKFTVSSDDLNKRFFVKKENDNSFKLFDRNHHFLASDQLNKLLKYNEISIEINRLDGPIGSTFTLIKHPEEQILATLIKKIKVQDLSQAENVGAEKTGILEISYLDSNKAQTVSILNTITDVILSKEIENKSNETARSLSLLSQQVPLVRRSLEDAERKLNKYRAVTGKIDIRIETQHLLTKLADVDKQIQKLQLTKVDMLQNYTIEHPFIIQLMNKIDALKKVQHELEEQLKTLPGSDQITSGLMRDVKIQTNLYLLLLTQIQQLKINHAAPTSNIQVLSSAQSPYEPLPRNPVIIILASMIIGFILSCMIIFIRKALSQSIEDPLWIEKHLNLLNVATIPFSNKQANYIRISHQHESRKIPLLAANHTEEIAIEALRSLRTSLQIMLLSSKNNLVSIMGISPTIGRSFIAANLGFLFAQAGKRVLLIDADLRRGCLKDYFNKSHAPGLVEAITGRMEIANCLQKTDNPNLTFLSTGELPPNPSELLMAARFKELMVSLSAEFDLVILDTSPILAFTDGIIVGGISGINLLVTGAEKHSGKEIEDTLSAVEKNGIKLNGYIFNYLKEDLKTYNRYRHYKYQSETIN